MASKPTGRPRGRPRGSKNIPRLEAFVAESIQAPAVVVPEAPRKLARGPWAAMTSDERSMLGKALNGQRRTHRGGKPIGVPRRMTVAQHDAHRAAQRPVIARVMAKLGERDQLPEDPMAVEALLAAMHVLRSPIAAKDKIAAARLILDFAKHRPTAKVENPVKTAEDFLDEMAE